MAAEAQVVQTPPAEMVRDGQVIEVYVDEKGSIYKELRYHGIIPGIRDELGKPKKKSKAKKKKKPVVSWIGFQSKQFYSRVFIKVDPVTRFIMRKVDASRIIIDIDDANIPSRQTRRPIITAAYDTAVESIQARKVRSGAQVEIKLRKPAGYLYKRQGDYIFIDIER
jgi:hypothetical protein